MGDWNGLWTGQKFSSVHQLVGVDVVVSLEKAIIITAACFLELSRSIYFRDFTYLRKCPVELVCLSAFLSVSLSASRSARVPACLSVRMVLSLSVHLQICLLVRPSVCPSVFFIDCLRFYAAQIIQPSFSVSAQFKSRAEKSLRTWNGVKQGHHQFQFCLQFHPLFFSVGSLSFFP